MGKISDLTQLFRRDEWSWQFSTVFDDSCTKLQQKWWVNTFLLHIWWFPPYVPALWLFVSNTYIGVLSENPQVITAQTLCKADLCQTGRFDFQPLAISVSSSHGFPYLLVISLHYGITIRALVAEADLQGGVWGYRSTSPGEEGWVCFV